MKRVALLIALSLCLAVGVFLLLKPQKIQGSAEVYDTITVQVGTNLFYNVYVPVEAVLEATDGAAIYDYDLLTIGVQSAEPSARCKVQVGDKWVYAVSKEGWLRATMLGFEQEQPYKGTYDLSTTLWTDELPPITLPLEQSILAQLRGNSYQSFGGAAYVTSEIMYGTFAEVTDRALLKMSTLYHQPILYGKYTTNLFWMTSNLYTVAVTPINYNTCLLITAYGEEGKQYAAAIMEEFT